MVLRRQKEIFIGFWEKKKKKKKKRKLPEATMKDLKRNKKRKKEVPSTSTQPCKPGPFPKEIRR